MGDRDDALPLVQLMADHMDLIRRIRPSAEEINAVLPENINAAGDERSNIELKVWAKPMGDPSQQDGTQPRLMALDGPNLDTTALEPIMTPDRREALNALGRLPLVDRVRLGIERVDMERVRRDHQRRREFLARRREREQQQQQVIRRQEPPPQLPPGYNRQRHFEEPPSVALLHRFHTEVGSRGSGSGGRRNAQGQWVPHFHLRWDGYIHGVHVNSNFEE